MRRKRQSKKGHRKYDTRRRIMNTGNRKNTHATPGNQKIRYIMLHTFGAWGREFSIVERDCVEQKN